MPEGVIDPRDPAASSEILDRMDHRVAGILAGRRYRIEGFVDEAIQRVFGVLLALAFTGEQSSSVTEATVGVRQRATTTEREPTAPVRRPAANAAERVGRLSQSTVVDLSASSP